MVHIPVRTFGRLGRLGTKIIFFGHTTRHAPHVPYTTTNVPPRSPRNQQANNPSDGTPPPWRFSNSHHAKSLFKPIDLWTYILPNSPLKCAIAKGTRLNHGISHDSPCSRRVASNQRRLVRCQTRGLARCRIGKMLAESSNKWLPPQPCTRAIGRF